MATNHRLPCGLASAQAHLPPQPLGASTSWNLHHTAPASSNTSHCLLHSQDLVSCLSVRARHWANRANESFLPINRLPSLPLAFVDYVDGTSAKADRKEGPCIREGLLPKATPASTLHLPLHLAGPSCGDGAASPRFPADLQSVLGGCVPSLSR